MQSVAAHHGAGIERDQIEGDLATTPVSGTRRAAVSRPAAASSVRLTDAPRTWQLSNAGIKRLLSNAEGLFLVGWDDCAHLQASE